MGTPERLENFLGQLQRSDYSHIITIFAKDMDSSTMRNIRKLIVHQTHGLLVADEMLLAYNMNKALDLMCLK